MFGTGFSYAQFERLQGVSRALEVERMPDSELNGKAVHLLAHAPPTIRSSSTC